MAKRVMALALVAVFLAPAVWSGGQQEGGAAEKQTIVHYHWTETVYDQINRRSVQAFEAANPNVSVEMLLFADADRANQIRLALSSDGDIDSFALANGEVAEFHENGQMVEIVPSAFGVSTVDEVVDMWKPGAMSSAGAIWNDRVYGLPFEQSNYVAWINTTYMREAGLDPETDLPGTWDEFVDVAQQLTVDQGGVRVRNGFATNPKASVFMFLIMTAMVEQQGLDWSTEEGFLESMQTPGLRRAVTTLTNFATEDGIWDPGLFDNEREGFGNGLTATFLTGGTWYWGVLDQYSLSRDDVTPFPYPRFAGGEDVGGVGYGYAVYVSRLADDPELTFAFLNELTARPNDFIREGYHQPRKTLDENLAAEFIPRYEVFQEELAKTATWLTSTRGAEIQDAVGAALSRIIFEGVAVDASLATLADDARSIIR